MIMVLALIGAFFNYVVKSRCIWFDKIIRIVRALSLVNRCVQMRVCKHDCDITQILIGFVLSDARSDWMVGTMSAHQENLFRSRS